MYVYRRKQSFIFKITNSYVSFESLFSETTNRHVLLILIVITRRVYGSLHQILMMIDEEIKPTKIKIL